MISLHCGLTDETRGLVDRRLLARVKPGAILVNVARGQIVESEDALAEALASGQLSAVALDVFPSEPPTPGHRLYADPRVICTPHAVGLTSRWNEQVFRSLARDVQTVLAGGLPREPAQPGGADRIGRSPIARRAHPLRAPVGRCPARAGARRLAAHVRPSCSAATCCTRATRSTCRPPGEPVEGRAERRDSYPILVTRSLPRDARATCSS